MRSAPTRNPCLGSRSGGGARRGTRALMRDRSQAGTRGFMDAVRAGLDWFRSGRLFGAAQALIFERHQTFDLRQ